MCQESILINSEELWLQELLIKGGMPIEQVQKVLGHSQIDTTMQYAVVNQNNVKNSHRKCID